MDYWFNSVDEYLKTSQKPWLRSLYSPEVNPWVRRGEIEAALLFRGAIVSSYGHIDTRLAELAIRSSQIPEYQDLRAAFPYSRDKRVSYLRKVFSRGPLSRFELTADSFFTKFEGMFETRDLVAHARMEVIVGSWVKFEHFPSSNADGTINHVTRPMTLDDLESFARRMGRLSRVCQKFCVKLEAEIDLPRLNQ